MEYDTSLKELENIVEKLSSASLSIEESIELYSNGIIIAKNALLKLNNFKGKIELLNKELEELELEIEDESNNDDD